MIPLLFDSPDVYVARCAGAGNVVVDQVVLVVGHEELVVAIPGLDEVGVVGVGDGRRWSARASSGSGGVASRGMVDGHVCVVLESDALVGGGCVSLGVGGGYGVFVVVGSCGLLGPDLSEQHGSLR